MKGGNPTVLGLINQHLESISTDVKEIRTELRNGAVTMKAHELRLNSIENNQKRIEEDQKKIKKDLFDHIGEKKKHYNQGYKETIPQRLMRKKTELTIITILTTVLGWVVNYYFGS
ncbi:MAG: hypothetical protein DRP09_13515 [Candidatus Thorarchaeota archaeon]|nr:MAG: hypothetical protein DRP09_13515 [Candidatus Thorarchaeota archaeon]